MGVGVCVYAMRKVERERYRVGGCVCMLCERKRLREGQSGYVQAM